MMITISKVELSELIWNILIYKLHNDYQLAPEKLKIKSEILLITN